MALALHGKIKTILEVVHSTAVVEFYTFKRKKFFADDLAQKMLR